MRDRTYVHEGDFQFFLQPPASRLHINELYLGAPITPNPLGNLFRTDGSNDVMNQWELFTGDIDVTSRKFRIYTNFDLQTQVNISQNYTLQNNQKIEGQIEGPIKGSIDIKDELKDTSSKQSSKQYSTGTKISR